MHNERFFCERGALIYYEDGIEVKLDVLGSGIGGLLKRAVSGESLVQVEIQNVSPSPRKLMVAGRSGILPLDLKILDGGIICRSGYYIASSAKVEFDFKLSLGSLIGGIGSVMQKIRGNCTVFMDSIGTAIKLDLKYGEVVHVDEKSFVCMGINMESQISSDYSARSLIGGEGFNMFRISGPGTVYVNSVNFK
jgi:uncharacterized protein (AIM24 family)